MRAQVTVIEKEYCGGWWPPSQWFKWCEVTVLKYEYAFNWIKQTGYGLYCKYEGCENGKKYTWSEWCFGIIGTKTFDNPPKKYMKEDLRSEGTCDMSNLGMYASALKDEIKVAETLKELSTVTIDKETYVPKSFLCNPYKKEITTWIVAKYFELKLQPNKVIGTMTWSINGIVLTNSGGSFPLPDVNVYLPKNDTSEQKTVRIKFTHDEDRSLRLQNMAKDGNYSFWVELRVKLTDVGNISDPGILVLRKEYAFEAHTLEGDQAYQNYLHCNVMTTNHIEKFKIELVVPFHDRISDPPGWGGPSVVPIDPTEWIIRKSDTFKNELKTISEKFSLRKEGDEIQIR